MIQHQAGARTAVRDPGGHAPGPEAGPFQGVVVLDGSLRVTAASAAAAWILGREPALLAGRRMGDAGVAPAVAAAWESACGTALRRGHGVPFTFPAADEASGPGHAYAAPVFDPADGRAEAVIVTLGGRPEDGEALRQEERRRRQNEVVVGLARRGLNDDGDDETGYAGRMPEIVQSAAATLEVDRVSVWRYSADRGEIRCETMYQASERRVSSGQVLRAVDYPTYFAALERERAVLADDAATAPATREFADSYLRPLGISSMLDAPIRTRAGVWGILCCEHVGPPRAWTADEAAFAAAIADLVAITVEAGERRAAVNALRLSESRFRTLFDCAPLGAFLLAEDTRITLANESAARLLGVGDPAAVEGRLYRAFLENPAGEALADALAAVRSGSDGCRRLEHALRPAEGQARWVAATVACVRDPVSARHRFLLLLDDVTSRRDAWCALERSEERFRAIADNINEVFWTARPDGTLEYLSPAFEQLWGVSASAALADSRVAWEAIVREDRWITDGMWERASPGNPFTVEYRIALPDGRIRWLRTTISASVPANGSAGRIVGVTEDVTERKSLEQQLVHDATHDPLTGLPNRIALFARLSGASERAGAVSGGCFAVLLIDLDNFKLVSDTLGRCAGDVLLGACGEELRGCVRPGDTVAHLGGDEFAVLLAPPTPVAEAVVIAGRIVEALRRPFRVDQHEVFVHPGVGIATRTDAAGTPEVMLRNADVALYHAKRMRGPRIAVFDEEMHSRSLRRLRLESELHRALERGEFVLEYQPVVHLESGAVAGFEALIRWRHPSLGLLYPGEFLGLAEDTGLITGIGGWVLDEACRTLSQWSRRAAGRTPPVAVNVSARQLANDVVLVEQIDRALALSGVSPALLKLEITEGSLLGEPVLGLLNLLRGRGIQLHIDDFGTGYSSLSYLHRLPASALKLDRSFVTDARSREVASAITLLAGRLTLDVVAEGIETASEHERMLQAGCGYGQGFYYAHPVGADRAERMIGTRLPA